MKNKIGDLRDHLFATIESLRDKDDPMPVDRARAIAELAAIAIESAKVEVAMLRVLDEMGAQALSTTGFIPIESRAEGQAPEPAPIQQQKRSKPSLLHPWRRWEKRDS